MIHAYKCGCVCVNHLNTVDVKLLLGFSAGGVGGTDETGTDKHTHLLPVISMGALIDVPAFFTAMATG